MYCNDVCHCLCAQVWCCTRSISIEGHEAVKWEKTVSFTVTIQFISFYLWACSVKRTLDVSSSLSTCFSVSFLLIFFSLSAVSVSYQFLSFSFSCCLFFCYCSSFYSFLHRPELIESLYYLSYLSPDPVWFYYGTMDM